MDTLQRFQDPETGLFREDSHDPIHTTAHCLAALELFDAGPRHPLRALAPLAAPGALEDFLDGLDWRGDPWRESHRGAGVYAARWLAGECDANFEDRYHGTVNAADALPYQRAAGATALFVAPLALHYMLDNQIEQRLRYARLLAPTWAVAQRLT